MNIKISIVIIICLIFLSSCYKILFSSVGALDKTASIEKIGNHNKQVLFIPMHHVGKPAFYADVKRKVDSLDTEGFVFFYEIVKPGEIDSLRFDTLIKKFRYVTGADYTTHKSQGGYIDTVNHTFLNKKMKVIEEEGLVNQPSYKSLGLDSSNSKWADVYLTDLVVAYENKFGPIILTKCDTDKRLGTKYTCFNRISKKQRKYILADYRNEQIVNKILADSSNKIALIFGSKHYKEIAKLLKQKDPTWKTE